MSRARASRSRWACPRPSQRGHHVGLLPNRLVGRGGHRRQRGGIRVQRAEVQPFFSGVPLGRPGELRVQMPEQLARLHVLGEVVDGGPPIGESGVDVVLGRHRHPNRAAPRASAVT